jgi:putative heme iron utilization protein
MSEKAPRSLLQEVTPEVVEEARELLRASRYAALATIDPRDGSPVASRVNLATLPDSSVAIFVSGLSPHTAGLRADPRASLLVGEVGKGDPLAHARLTLKCTAEEIDRTRPEWDALSAPYLFAHPKSKLYFELPDFVFFRLRPSDISFVAGFGRAYRIAGADFCA